MKSRPLVVNQKFHRSERSLLWLLALSLILLGTSGRGLAAEQREAAPGDAVVKVESSSRQVLRFSTEGLQVRWEPRSVTDGLTLFDPQVEGFATVGDPARPRVPRSGGWVIVPPGTRPELVTLQEKWETAGSRPLMVQGVPIILPGEEPGLGTTSEILVLPGQDVPADAPIPTRIRAELSRPAKTRNGSAVELGPATWWRGHRIVPYTLLPVQHDGQGRAARSLVSGSWEIRFVNDPGADKSIPEGHRQKTTTRGDTRFGRIFLNNDLLESLPTAASLQGFEPSSTLGAKGRGGKSGTLLGNMEGRLAVTQTGLFKVTRDRLVQLGFIPSSGVDESEIRLYQRRYLERLDDGSGQAPYVEIEVPIHMTGEGDEFSGDDYFLFYGLRPRDDVGFNADLGQGPEAIAGCGDNYEMNNPANIYWVAASQPQAGQAWARMETTSLTGATGQPLAGYRRTEHNEEQRGFRELQPETTADRVYYNSANDTEVNVGFNPLWSPDPNGGDVTFQIAVTGQNESTRELTFNVVNAANQTTLLDNYDLSTMAEVVRNSFVPASAFYGASAKVVMSPRSGNPLDRVFSYLNWVKVSYDALYQAVGGRLEFHTGNEAGPRPIEVGGFTSSDLILVDLQDKRNPKWVDLTAANILADGGGWKLSIQANNPTAQPHSYYVAQTPGGTVIPEFSYYESSLASDQVNPVELSGPAPDLIVITHEEFREALEPWIEHRIQRSGGELNVHVVLVQELYDWYSGGLRDPWALKRFANHAITRWGSWALTLVGDANENALELGVLPSARAWSTDWVPTHYHVQDTGQYNPELMASDKWYATLQAGQNYPVEDFPDFTYQPWEMYIGRLPCNSVAELNTMVGKIQDVEDLQPGQVWRQRGVFFADDAWSNGYGADAFTFFTYRSWEEDFARSERDSLAPIWASGSPVPLTPVELYLATYLDPFWEGHGLENRPSALFKDYTESDATPPLLAALSQGALVAHYQGHGNPYVLASEYWMEDRLGFYRKDVTNLNNAGKPWVFFGMGCHIADWAQNPVYTPGTPREQSLCEKFMVRSGGGASAAYGSSGYEYIDANKIFGEYIFRRWMRHPPVATLSLNGTEHRSRWMLGEMMWAAEADLLAVLGANSTYREMVAQYTLLGDPLMMLDAGEPVVTAELLGEGGGAVSGEVDLAALDDSNQRSLRILAKDEAGIHRIEVRDDGGQDLASQMVTESLPAGATDHQEVHFDLLVPINPYDHRLTVKVYDTSGPLATDRHYELILNLAQTCEFATGGEVIDPTTYVFAPDEPVVFNGSVSGSTWFSDAMTMTLTSENLDLSNVNFDLGKSNQLAFEFTAVAPAGTSGDRSVVLTVDGYETVYPLQEEGAQLPLSEISNVLNYPNPMRENTRFIFESGASSGEGVIRVYSTSGRHVARIPFQFPGGGAGLVNWDGRDSDGDALGNGTYLYRIEMATPAGRIVSDMQRLVVMR